MALKFFKCEHCGNIAIKVVDAGVPMTCCGEKMVELAAGAVDAALEKHVPAVSVEGSVVTVKVGEVTHPMLPEHFINFIVLETSAGFQVAQLAPETAPEAVFVLPEGATALRAYEYCNLHGLWVKEL